MHEKGIKKRDPRYQNRYPFTGKLVCGECGTTFKRHIASTEGSKYAVWVCKKHLNDLHGCSMKAIRESDLERAFATMLNKLIFYRKELLVHLLDEVRGEAEKVSIHNINEIEQRLEKNAERRQTLTAVMAKGYLDPALFTQESNNLTAEENALTAEKERLSKTVDGNYRKTEELIKLVEYAKHSCPTPSFVSEPVEKFLEKATVISRTEITFHLKCGLNLTERM